MSPTSAPMDAYANERGKSSWCEKAITTVMGTEALGHIFPEAKYVCLYRSCFDAVHSGIEASKWGYGGYGFEPYVRNFPGNIVEALVNHWCDYTERIRTFEVAHPDRCVALRYEDMVTESDNEMARVCSSLGLAEAPSLVVDAFAQDHDFAGGDHKIIFTDGILTTSIGAGRQLPATAITASTRERMNELHGTLGYEPITEHWHLGSSPVQMSEGHARDESERFTSCILGPGGLRATAPGRHQDCVLLRVEDLSLEWHIDVAEGQVSASCPGPEGHDAVLVGRSSAIQSVLSGESNLGSAIRAGLIRSSSGVSAPALVFAVLRDRYASRKDADEREVQRA